MGRKPKEGHMTQRLMSVAGFFFIPTDIVQPVCSPLQTSRLYAVRGYACPPPPKKPVLSHHIAWPRQQPHGKALGDLRQSCRVHQSCGSDSHDSAERSHRRLDDVNPPLFSVQRKHRIRCWRFFFLGGAPFFGRSSSHLAHSSLCQYISTLRPKVNE